MPAGLVIDGRLGVVFTLLTGVLCREDLWNHRQEIVAHPEFHPHFHQWIDMRDVASFALSAEDIARFAGPTVFSSASRRAFIIASDLEYGLARMFETYAVGEFLICRDAEEASRFLGIEGKVPHSLR